MTLLCSGIKTGIRVGVLGVAPRFPCPIVFIVNEGGYMILLEDKTTKDQFDISIAYILIEG
jgi:hypothetical protein